MVCSVQFAKPFKMLSVKNIYVLTILCLVVTQAAASPCSETSNGFEPHPTDCTRYYECVRGQANPKVCPDGKLFDIYTLECSTSANSVCGNGNQTPGTKDLLIVFDATSSMIPHAAQLRAAAIEIVNELARKEDDPISQFILSVYRDPDVEDVFVTTDPNALISALNNIKVGNIGINNDCEELALLGLKNALEVAAENSIAFLFTDASAKDYQLYDSVVRIIQDKQIQVHFLITGNCGHTNNQKGLVFYQIADVSGGQVFNMKTTDIENVLLVLSPMLDSNFESLMTFGFERAGRNVVNVHVDTSFETLMISAAGTNAQLTIMNTKNETVPVTELVSLSNIKIVTLEAHESEYLIDATAQSAYTIRVGGISEMSFDFGFSVRPARFLNETQRTPIPDLRNILSVFVTNTLNLRFLDSVSLISASDSSKSIEIPLTSTTSGVFATALFEVPEEMFKIRVFGKDNEENVIDRIISTGIEVNRNASTTPRPVIDCSLLASGVASHPTDCTKYHECINGITFERSCPDGHVFDIYTLECGDIETSICEN